METAILNNNEIIYPFEWDGKKFQSRVLTHSDIFVSAVTTGVSTFISINQECLSELIGKGNNLDFIKTKLMEINKGGSFAFIELVEE